MVTVTDVKICFLNKNKLTTQCAKMKQNVIWSIKWKITTFFFILNVKKNFSNDDVWLLFFLLLWLSLFRYNYTVTPDILQSSSWPFKVSPPFPQDGWLFIKRIFFYFQKSKLKRFSPINNISWRVEHRFQFLYLQ